MQPEKDKKPKKRKNKENIFRIIEITLFIISFVFSIYIWNKANVVEEKNKELNKIVRKPNFEIIDISVYECEFSAPYLIDTKLIISLKPSFLVVFKNNSPIGINWEATMHSDTISNNYTLRDRFNENLPINIIDNRDTNGLYQTWIKPGDTDTLLIERLLINGEPDSLRNVLDYFHLMILYSTDFGDLYDIYCIQKFTILHEIIDEFINLDGPADSIIDNCSVWQSNYGGFFYKDKNDRVFYRTADNDESFKCNDRDRIINPKVYSNEQSKYYFDKMDKISGKKINRLF